jgi:hypothetical protein
MKYNFIAQYFKVLNHLNSDIIAISSPVFHGLTSRCAPFSDRAATIRTLVDPHLGPFATTLLVLSHYLVQKMSSSSSKINAEFIKALCDYRDETSGPVKFPLADCYMEDFARLPERLLVANRPSVS